MSWSNPQIRKQMAVGRLIPSKAPQSSEVGGRSICSWPSATPMRRLRPRAWSSCCSYRGWKSAHNNTTAKTNTPTTATANKMESTGMTASSRPMPVCSETRHAGFDVDQWCSAKRHGATDDFLRPRPRLPRASIGERSTDNVIVARSAQVARGNKARAGQGVRAGGAAVRSWRLLSRLQRIERMEAQAVRGALAAGRSVENAGR